MLAVLVSSGHTLWQPAGIWTLIDWLILAELKQSLNESTRNLQCLDLVQHFKSMSPLFVFLFCTFSFLSVLFSDPTLVLHFSWIYTEYNRKTHLLAWSGLPCVKWIFISEQRTQNINPVSCSPSPRQWATTAMPFWATGRPSCGNTSKCCLRSPCSAGWAPADRLRPSALMTYRLERRGIHVSGQCHGPTAKTVGEGEKESQRLLSILSDRGLAPGLCHITLPPNRPQMKDVKSERGEEGQRRGALQLKRLSSCKLKRHYLLTWRCPLWGRTLWCKNTRREREREQRTEKRRIKNGRRKGKHEAWSGFNW